MELLRSSAQAQKVPASWRHRNGSLCQKLTTFGEKPGSHLAVELGFFLVRSRVVSQGKQNKALPAAHMRTRKSKERPGARWPGSLCDVGAVG